MTDSILTNGCEWCNSCLHDGWGDASDDEVVDAARRVVTEFHRLAADASYGDVYWTPKTSEVVHNIEDGATPEMADQWRDQAFANVAKQLGML